MRKVSHAFSLALILCSSFAFSADVNFELGQDLFEQSASDAKQVTVIPAYDGPLYEGLWPMTREHFQGDINDADQYVFMFNIAMNR